jgi:hypothetical protein
VMQGDNFGGQGGRNLTGEGSPRRQCSGDGEPMTVVQTKGQGHRWLSW